MFLEYILPLYLDATVSVPYTIKLFIGVSICLCVTMKMDYYFKKLWNRVVFVIIPFNRNVEIFYSDFFSESLSQ